MQGGQDHIARMIPADPFLVNKSLKTTFLRNIMKAVPFPVDLQDWERFIFETQFSVVTGVRGTWTGQIS